MKSRLLWISFTLFFLPLSARADALVTCQDEEFTVRVVLPGRVDSETERFVSARAVVNGLSIDIFQTGPGYFNSYSHVIRDNRGVFRKRDLQLRLGTRISKAIVSDEAFTTGRAFDPANNFHRIVVIDCGVQDLE